METFDCVVIGAGESSYKDHSSTIAPRLANTVAREPADFGPCTGWYGLGAAKQYHCICPESSLVIFDSAPTLGGTWADHRIYPGLKSNNLFGTYEFPDFPMDTEVFGVKPREHIPGSVLNAYLRAYAANFGIDSLIRANTKVTTAKHEDTPAGGWVLTTESAGKDVTTVFARRLIVATGLTSEAYLPRFDGQDTFGGRVFHGKDFLQNKDTIQEGKSVTVYGGTKFAWDAVYAYASAGVKVDWVIRCMLSLEKPDSLEPNI